MTQEIQWGPAIAVDGKRPGWLGDWQPIKGTYNQGRYPWVGSDTYLAKQFDWQHVKAIRLPADHPHCRQTEEAPIDWSGELEAVHEDGRVVSVTLAPNAHGYSGSVPRVTNECPAEDTNDNWYEDGTDFCRNGKWRIRNVPQSTPQADTKPDLTARTEALVRRVAKAGPSPSYDEGMAIATEACIIEKTLLKPEAAQPFDVPRAPCMTISEVREMVAKGEDAVIATMLERGYALPEPVDEDLVEARKLAHEYAGDQAGWQGILEGKHDSSAAITQLIAAIKRGRALALAGEKEA